MADNRVNQLLSLINQQIKYQETIKEYLFKAEALINVTLGDNFLDFPKFTIHDYLSTLSDVLENAIRMSEKTSNILFKEMSHNFKLTCPIS